MANDERRYPMRQLHGVLASPLIGGAGLVAIRLASALTRRKLPCTAWVPGQGPASEALARENVGWRLYDLDAMKRGAFTHLASVARMSLGLVGRRRPIVHVHNPTVFRLLYPALAAARARTVVHFQIEPSREEVRYALKYPPSQIVTCARYIADAVRSAQADEGRQVPVAAVPNAIDLKRYRPGNRAGARARVGLQPDGFVLLMMANLAPHKGQATVLRAVQGLHARGIPVECWLAGEDRSEGRAYEAELRALARELRIGDRVRFLGFRSDGPDLLRAADVFLLPSTHEGLPLSVLEAQASGVPVIGSTILGVREIVDEGKTGFLIEADDHVTCADRVRTLYEQPSVREGMIEASSRAVAQYGWSMFEERMVGIYRALF